MTHVKKSKRAKRNLEVGKEYIFDAHSGNDTWPLKTKVIGKEKVKVEEVDSEIKL